MTPGLLVVISGPGGVGKDTIIERLLELDPRLRYSISFTTRPQRDYERDGRHYTFVSGAEFHELARQGEFLEHKVVNGHHYGTSTNRVEALQASGHDVILKIDVHGAEEVRRRRPDGVFIFIAPPSMQELLRRRISRGSDTAEVIEARQRLAELEMGFADRYDHVVVNDQVDAAVAQVESILERERRARGTTPEPV